MTELIVLAACLTVIGTIVIARTRAHRHRARELTAADAATPDPLPDGERRVDLGTRARIAQLERRYRRSTYLLTALCMTMAAVLTLGLFFQGADSRRLDRTIGDVQQSRVEATEGFCRGRNDDHAKIVGFVARVAPGLAAPAAKDFPVEPDCHAYALKRVGIHR